MANLKERVAYLQGLTQGLNINSLSAEGKLLVNIIDVLGAMAEELNNIQMEQEDLKSYVESLDEDLTDLEEEVYGDDDEDSGGEDYVEVQAVEDCTDAINHISA